MSEYQYQPPRKPHGSDCPCRICKSIGSDSKYTTAELIDMGIVPHIEPPQSGCDCIPCSESKMLSYESLISSFVSTMPPVFSLLTGAANCQVKANVAGIAATAIERVRSRRYRGSRYCSAEMRRKSFGKV